MLWSLIKIIAFIAIVTGLTFGAVYLMNTSGGADITIAGYNANLSTLELTIGFALLILLVWLLLKLMGLLVATFKFLNGDETAI